MQLSAIPQEQSPEAGEASPHRSVEIGTNTCISDDQSTRGLGVVLEIDCSGSAMGTITRTGTSRDLLRGEGHRTVEYRNASTSTRRAPCIVAAGSSAVRFYLTCP